MTKITEKNQKIIDCLEREGKSAALSRYFNKNPRALEEFLTQCAFRGIDINIAKVKVGRKKKQYFDNI